LVAKDLKESNAQVSDLEQQVTSLRQSLAQTNDKLNRKTEALKIAGKNAVNARADAEAAEARTSGFIHQIAALRKVIDDTEVCIEKNRAFLV
jgi:hypothetical protein